MRETSPGGPALQAEPALGPESAAAAPRGAADQVFVGREHELAELKAGLDSALAGRGRVCFVSGEAGSGKTALVQRFLQYALTEHADIVVGMGACNAQAGIGDPYLPFREVLAMLTDEDAARRSGGPIAPENSRRLRTVVARSVQVLVDVAPELIGVFVPGVKLLGTIGKSVANKAGWMDQLDELAARKQGAADPLTETRIFEQYTAYLQRLSTKVPLVLFLDDLQWADNASLALLFHLGRSIGTSRILILGAYRGNDVAMGRDGGRHPLETIVHELTRYGGDVSVDLDAIPEHTSRLFVDALLDTQPNRLDEPFRQALYHQTGGHALFVVELLRSMRERGDLVRDRDGHWVEAPALDWSALPAKVEGVIAERIARLNDELRQMLTVGSVEGERFAAEMVARVRAMADRDAIRRLSNELQKRHRLVNALGLVQIGGRRLSFYRFAHNLFQQYLYKSLDDVERSCLHWDVGEALEALFGDQTEEISASLAYHFEEAQVLHKAAQYRLQAGDRAHRLSAHQEAANHLARGLELSARLPDSAERTRLELQLQTLLGTTRIATHGYASPDVEQAFAQARQLCFALGDPPEVVPVLFGLCLFYMVRGELERAHSEQERAFALVEVASDRAYWLGFHFLLGATTLYEADLQQARWHLEQVAQDYDIELDASHAHKHGHDPGVVSLLYLSWVLWFQGHIAEAIARMEQGLELAEALAHPHTSTLAAFFASTFHQLMRQWPQCRAEAERALALAGQGRFPFWQAGCTMLRGSALANQGQVDEGIAVLREGLAAWEATGTHLALPYFRARLAEAYLLAGRREEGLEALAQSFLHPQEVWWHSEQHRLHAELLLLAPGYEAEAEALLRRALGIARSQRSLSLELRAALSLARLLERQGRVAEGLGPLAECCTRFTEGYDCADIREVREYLHGRGVAPLPRRALAMGAAGASARSGPAVTTGSGP